MAGPAPNPETLEECVTFCSAGTYVLVESDVGTTVAEAKRKAMAHFKHIKITNDQFWRVDIGDRLKKQLPLLRQHGYCKGLYYSAAAPAPEPKQEGVEIGGLKVIYV